MFGNFCMLFWLVNVGFHGLYGLSMFGWISDRFGFQTAKRKKFGGKGQGRIRPEPGRIAGQIALENLVSGQLLSGRYPARFGWILTWPTLFMFGSDFRFSFCGFLIHLSALLFSGIF